MEVLSPQFTPLKNRWFRRSWFYGLLLAGLVLGYFAIRLGSAYYAIVVPGGKLASQATLTPEPDRLDVLILGIRGYDAKAIAEEGGLLTDTIQVVSIDKRNKRVGIISLPRDLYIEMDGGKHKINEMYEIGLEQNRGMAFSEETVSRLTGVHVDNTVVFDFNAFQYIVDTLGGIDIILAKPFSEPTEWGYPFNLPAGPNHLTGEQALYYARSRFSTNDFDRSRRQQEIISAIANRAAQQGYLTNPVKITNLLSAIKGDLRTDFQLWDLNDLLALARSFKPGTPVKTAVLGLDNYLYEAKSPKGEYVLLPKGNNYDGIKKLFTGILKGETK